MHGWNDRVAAAGAQTTRDSRALASAEGRWLEPPDDDWAVCPVCRGSDGDYCDYCDATGQVATSKADEYYRDKEADAAVDRQMEASDV